MLSQMFGEIYMIKVIIIARPDHSLNLYQELKSSKLASEEVSLVTFSALRDGSLEADFFPKLKRAPSDAITLNMYTIFSRLMNIPFKFFGWNYMLMNKNIFKFFFKKEFLHGKNIIHYWPFYAIDVVRPAKLTNGFKTVAEFYEADPDFVNEIFQEEYSKFGLIMKKKINKMINQNEVFEFEENFIVASEYTKNSYSKKFPDKNFYVCKYGPLGMKLAETAKIVEFSNHRKLVFVGQVCVEKGVHYLIEAVRQMDVQLDLIGPIRSEQYEIFRNLIDNSPNVTYLGSKRNSEVLSLLSNYSLFCLPSLSDNYSIAVVEALSKKIPVIVTTNCGNADDVIAFDLGVVVSIKSSEEITEALKHFTHGFDYLAFSRGLELFFSAENASNYPQSVLSVYRKIGGY